MEIDNNAVVPPLTYTDDEKIDSRAVVDPLKKTLPPQKRGGPAVVGKTN